APAPSSASPPSARPPPPSRWRDRPAREAAPASARPAPGPPRPGPPAGRRRHRRPEAGPPRPAAAAPRRSLVAARKLAQRLAERVAQRSHIAPQLLSRVGAHLDVQEGGAHPPRRLALDVGGRPQHVRVYPVEPRRPGPPAPGQ